MKMMVDGKYIDAKNNAVIEIRNSATGELVDTTPDATPEDMQNAIVAAQRGKKTWAAMPQRDRSKILSKCADAIEAHYDELVKMLTTEMGKPIPQTQYEIGVASEIFRGYAEMANHLFGQTMTQFQKGSERDVLFTRREPLGVVGCITPFNYPVELCYHKVAGSLAVGNAVIIKPSEENPMTILRVAQLCWESGVPGDVLQVVTGQGPVIGPVLASSKDVDAISFTGSTEVGLKIAALAGQTLKHVSLELGGNDPFIVFEDADMEIAISEAVGGRLSNAGQTCCAPKRFIVHSSVLEEFTQGVIDRLKNVKAGCPLSEETELGSLISPEAAERVERQVEQTISQGAKLALGGKRYDVTYFEPTVLTGVTRDMDIAKDMEVFGPVYPIIAFNTFDEDIEIANNTQYGLNAGIISKDFSKAMKTASMLESGSVIINGSGCYRNVDQPFGGVKMSGVGREGICCTLQAMSREKTFILKNSFVD